MTDNIVQMDATRIAELIATRELSPVDVVQAHWTLPNRPRPRSSRALDWGRSMAFRSPSRMESTRRVC